MKAKIFALPACASLSGAEMSKKKLQCYLLRRGGTRDRANTGFHDTRVPPNANLGEVSNKW